jgi:hypothetical protein
VSHIIVVTTRSPRVEVDDVGKSVPELDYWLGKYASSPWVMLVTVLPSQCWQWCEVAAESCWHGNVEVTYPWRNVAAESCWRWRCWGDIDRGIISLLRNIIVESCWRRCCRVMLATALSGWLCHNACCRVMLATALSGWLCHNAIW